MMRADLHIHTTASDGIFPPEAILAMAKDANISAIAISDHDTMDSVPAASALARELDLLVIPGVEISAGGDEEIHILSYGQRPDAPALTQLFHDMRKERIGRAHRVMDLLEQLHMPLDRDQVFLSANGSVGRPHIARAMVQKGYVSSVRDAFDRYLAKGKAAFVSREKLSPARVIRLLRDCDGIPVLAHPILLSWPQEKLLPLLKEWKDAGLCGLEVYHPSQKQDFASWLRLARKMDLLITGGSDYHAPDRPDGPMGGTADMWLSAQEDVEALLHMIRANQSV